MRFLTSGHHYKLGLTRFYWVTATIYNQLFYGIEKPLENERYNEMVKEHKRVSASVKYLSSYLSDLHYK